MAGRRYIKPFRGIRLNKAHPLAKNLEGCWIFNEMSGLMVFDHSGRRRHGTVYLDSGSQGGWLRGGLYLQGWDNSKDDVVQVGNDNFDDGRNELTIIAAIRDATVIDQHGNDAAIMFKTEAFRLDFNDGDELRLRIIDSSLASTSATYANAISDGETGVFAGTWDGEWARVYKNGQEVGSAQGARTLNQNSNAVEIGGRPDNPYSLDAIIDFVLVFSRCLTPEEVAFLTWNPYALFEEPLMEALFEFNYLPAGTPVSRDAIVNMEALVTIQAEM